MRYLISPAVLAVILTACGGGGEDQGAGAPVDSAASSSAPGSETSTAASVEPEGESTDCLLSATKFADRAGDHALSFATTAPALGEREKLQDLDDLLSEISVLCSDGVNNLANDVMEPLTEANFEVSLCAMNPDPAFGGCRRAQNSKVHKIGERAASLVGQLRDTLGA